MSDLIIKLRTEADNKFYGAMYLSNDGAQAHGNLLKEAADALTAASARTQDLEAELKNHKNALIFAKVRIAALEKDAAIGALVKGGGNV